MHAVHAHPFHATRFPYISCRVKFPLNCSQNNQKLLPVQSPPPSTQTCMSHLTILYWGSGGTSTMGLFGRYGYLVFHPSPASSSSGIASLISCNPSLIQRLYHYLVLRVLSRVAPQALVPTTPSIDPSHRYDNQVVWPTTWYQRRDGKMCQ